MNLRVIASITIIMIYCTLSIGCNQRIVDRNLEEKQLVRELKMVIGFLHADYLHDGDYMSESEFRDRFVDGISMLSRGKYNYKLNENGFILIFILDVKFGPNASVMVTKTNKDGIYYKTYSGNVEINQISIVDIRKPLSLANYNTTGIVTVFKDYPLIFD